MAKYTIKDFSKGDEVYHLSNRQLIMIAVEISTDDNEISCRLTDNKGQTKYLKFMPEELGKKKDLFSSTIRIERI